MNSLTGEDIGEIASRMGASIVKAPAVARLEADLRQHLQHKSTLISPEITHVVADVNRFTSTILRNSFRMALGELLTSSNNSKVRLDRPFIEVCDVIIEQHVRNVKEADRELVSKSLFEAYIYFAGAQHVFEPATKTRLIQSLRRRGVKGFAGLFLSLHLFNVVCMEIQDKVGARMPDQKSFELYMLGMEAVCRDVVTRAMKIPDAELDARWAAAIQSNIEAQLLPRR